MAFKEVARPSPVPDSPDKLLRLLPRRKIPDVLPHQQEMMVTYVAQALDAPDVALQLPTGSGKTLVGLLIAEWRRRKAGERVVYLCPTKQLVNQVVEQSEEKYGLSVLGFTGAIKSYEPTAKTGYRNADAVAVTTYSSLFNTNPFFHDADLIIVDDAHAAESYIAAMWTLRVSRTFGGHAALHQALCGVLKSHVEPGNYARLTGNVSGPADWSWVDKLPSPVLAEINDQLIQVFDAHVDGKPDLSNPWRMLRENLHGCQLYLSPDEILLRPLIPPTWTHAPFASARQRIFMSATLGAGGDLERLTGRPKIKRLPAPKGWDLQGVGRRFFMFPGMSLKEIDATTLRLELMKRAGRSLVLVPSDPMRVEIATQVEKRLGFSTFSADDIETSKKPFIATPNAAAIVANRYDGIDFPGNECRLLFIAGLPKATNLQERFLMSRMGANILLNERIQTRVLQAIGRCTRSLEDYSAVVVSGTDLADYLANIKRRPFLHPELQAELIFGVAQSKGASISEYIENFETFLRNDKEWEKANQQIISARATAAQIPFPAMDELRAVVEHELEWQAKLWQGDFAGASAAAERVLGGLKAPELRGYRALWHYLAGSALWLGAKSGIDAFEAKARAHYAAAKAAAIGIRWLVQLAQFQSGDVEKVETADASLLEQIERVEAFLESCGTLHDGTFAEHEKKILEGLASPKTFEQAQRLLGELLGFSAGKVESEASPDPWWIAGRHCFVFEDYVNAEADSVFSVTKARQTESHPKWMRDFVPASALCEILPVLVTSVSGISKGAVSHAKGTHLWRQKDFIAWAQKAIATIRELRTTFLEPGDLVWQAQAAEAFEKNGLSAIRLSAILKASPVVGQLTVIG